MKGIKEITSKFKNIFKKDWKNIHLDFNEELQKQWEEKGFSYETCKEWINAGLQVNDADYAQWLTVVKQKDPKWVLSHGNKRKLIQENNEYLVAVENGSKLSVEVIKQIRDFESIHQAQWKNSEEENLLRNRFLERLMPDNKELREKYRSHGLCEECQQPKSSSDWCQSCNSNHFQEKFSEWTSGNQEIDECIKEHQLRATGNWGVLEWIPYDKLTNIELLAEGGFGKVYKAKWVDGSIKEWDIKSNQWQREKDCDVIKTEKNIKHRNYKSVVLKSLNNSQDLSADFLQEITCHKLAGGFFTVDCYGISQNPSTKDYVMVMDYKKGGNLRQYLQGGYNDYLEFHNKLSDLCNILRGLSCIHGHGLVHRDFHPGNILKGSFLDISMPGYDTDYAFITDLGLCRPANETNKEKVYGVLPYVAPEVLRGESYTQAADIYSWGMIAYEILTNLPPYHDLSHDHFLAMNICSGLRPNLDSIQIPQLLKDLIKRCWDANPEQRPIADDMADILSQWFSEIIDGKNTEFTRQCKPTFDAEEEIPHIFLSRLYDRLKETKSEEEIECEELYFEFCKKFNYEQEAGETMEKFDKAIDLMYSDDQTTSNSMPHPCKTHPQAVYTSRLLDFGNLPKPQNSKEINEQFWGSTDMELNINNLNIQEDTQEQSSYQANIQLPPKQ